MTQMEAPQNYLAVIKAVGIGGGGVNAVNRMIEAGLRGVEFIAVNTDAQTLLMSDAEVTLDIGRAAERGRGAGVGPRVRRHRAPGATRRRVRTRPRWRRASRAPAWCSAPRAGGVARAPAARRSSRRSPGT